MTSNIVVGPADSGLPALVILGCHTPFFAECIENDRDQVIFDFLPIVDIFPDSLGEKSRFVESFW